MKLENFEKDYQLQQQNIWYLKPGYLKLVQTGPFQKGIAVNSKPDGSITAYKSGRLSFIKVKLDKDDPRLYGVTKDHLYDTDYGTIIKSAGEISKKIKDYKIERILE